MTETPDGSVQLEYSPFNDDLTKAEMVEHLVGVHRIMSVRGESLTGSTKVTKDRMIRHHAIVHDVLEGPDRRDDPTALYYYQGQRIAGARREGTNEYHVPVPKVEHTHPPITVPPETMAQAGLARNNEPVSDKPLSTVERKVLKELVDNDFNALKSEMRQFAADAWTQTKREVEAEWAERVGKAPGYAARRWT